MWTELFKRGKYTFWQNDQVATRSTNVECLSYGKPYFNVTEDGKAPRCNGGYYNLGSLLKTKGLIIKDWREK